ncbi:antitoxin MazE family protein [Azohydromonas lata]|uniref:Antitoxin MazE family protein n=1 Tax=Azohydromonas lata TaxID=45677 RepID=A0ABU5I9Y2_9BURK|nr:antitoxin MazE family protein [Azohydromonas lata]MDZ5455909.1 antitoxin MazE family protein [Azohydromonas lata]
MATPTSQRVRKHREGLRQAGMRPVQLWVPDTRAQQFTQECRRQCLLVAQADAADPEVFEVLDAALDDLEGWHA